jgi:prepilin-type N-terminal cleavage/methylation domain-containing protein
MNLILRKQLAKKNSKKGFTLVELVVVILIIAILAAISIPALTGYIDKAREKQLLSDGHTIQTALQTIINEAYANTGVAYTTPEGSNIVGSHRIPGMPDESTFFTEIEKLTGKDYDHEPTWDYLNSIVIKNGVLTRFWYGPRGNDDQEQFHPFIKYENGKFTIVHPEPHA